MGNRAYRRARGLVTAPRADVSDATTILNELKRTVEAHQTEVNSQLAALKKDRTDPVQDEKVEKINADVSRLMTELDGINATLAALKVGGTAAGAQSEDQLTHAHAFNRFFRRGDEPTNMRELEVKAKLTTATDTDGGFLVPEETEATIDRVLGTVSTVRNIARAISISGDTYKKLVNQGGAASGWVGESDPRSETNTPKLVEIAINAHEIYAQPAATQKSLDDARIDIAKWLADEVSIEFAEQEGAAFVNGNGVLKPRGILAYDKVANASYTWGKTGFVVSGHASAFLVPTASVNPADAFIDLYYALKAGYRNGASWLMSDATMGAVRKFKDADGGFIWAPPSAVGEQATILGKPVYNDDNMDAVGANKFPVAFGNYQRGYLIVDRAGIRVLRDPFTSKPNVLFYTTKRVGGGITNFEAIKLMKIST